MPIASLIVVMVATLIAYPLGVPLCPPDHVYSLQL